MQQPSRTIHVRVPRAAFEIEAKRVAILPYRLGVMLLATPELQMPEAPNGDEPFR